MPSSNDNSACGVDAGRSARSKGGARRGALVLTLVLATSCLVPWPAGAASKGKNKTAKQHVRSSTATFTGCCDASGAAPVDGGVFAAASDEENVLRLYSAESGGAPLSVVDVHRFLGATRGDEADLEAAARIGSRIFWIGSHARNADGQIRPARHVLFATAIQGEGADARLVPDLQPYRGLASALAAEPRFAEFHFVEAAQLPPEKPGGLNIEGLAAGPEGSLLVGLRNPVPERRALVIPLLNPVETLSRAKPRFGTPLRLDLGGLGIRDLARSGEDLWIIGGPAEGGGRHRLFRLASGALPGQAPESFEAAIPKGFQAESIVVLGPGAGGSGTGTAAGGGTAGPRLLVLGDEGGEKVGGQRCEQIRNPLQRAFHGVWFLPVE